MTKSRFFVGCAISFAIGITLQSRYEFTTSIILCYTSAVVAILAIAYQSRKSSAFIILAWWLLWSSLGMLRMHMAVQDSEYTHILNTKQQIDGVIVADVDMRVDKQFLTIQPQGHNQYIRVTTTKYQNYFYGDRLLLNGKVTEAKSDADFDYKAYLLRWNTYALMSYPKIIILKHGQGHWWVRGLLEIKYAFIRQVNKVLSEVESNLLLGILIGARKGLPEEVTENFNVTGVSHVIAISGYNISILASSLIFLDKRLGRKISFWLTLVVILAFVIMSGASASVVRAALMGGLVLLSSRVGRLYAITPSLCMAAVMMLLLNPRILYWDASFQLSFLATVGVVYIAPLVEELTAKWPGLFGVKSILITTMSAIIATLPFILYQFGRLSVVAPLVNVLILPLVPTSMLFGFLTGIPVLGYGFGLIAHWLLLYMLNVTDYFAHLKYASTEVHIGQILFILSYVVLGVLYFIGKLWLEHKRESMIQ